jgi:hypothetical protein
MHSTGKPRITPDAVQHGAFDTEAGIGSKRCPVVGLETACSLELSFVPRADQLVKLYMVADTATQSPRLILYEVELGMESRGDFGRVVGGHGSVRPARVLGCLSSQKANRFLKLRRFAQ